MGDRNIRKGTVIRLHESVASLDASDDLATIGIGRITQFITRATFAEAGHDQIGSGYEFYAKIDPTNSNNPRVTAILPPLRLIQGEI